MDDFFNKTRLLLEDDDKDFNLDDLNFGDTANDGGEGDQKEAPAKEEDDQDQEEKEKEDEVPDLEDDGDEDNNDLPGEEEQVAAAEGEKKADDTISGSRDDIIDAIDKALKDGKKVTIEIANESKGAGSCDNVISAKEYKALVRKKKSDEKLTKKEKKQMEKYENCKKEKRPVNETAVVKALYHLSDRLDEMDAKIKGKHAINKVMEENKAMNEYNTLMRSLDESNYMLDNIIRSNRVRKNTIAMNSVIDRKKNAFTNRTMKSVMPVISTISEAATNAIDSVTFYEIIKEQAIIEEAHSKMDSLLNGLSEASAMFGDAVGLDNEWMPKANVEAPSYLSQKFGSSTSFPASSNMSDINDGYTKESVPCYKLPVSKNIDTGKLSVSSAMSAIAEAFTVDGKLDVNKVRSAFLYQKVRKPKTMNDFAIPIAAIEEGNLVAVPKFLEVAAKIVANENGLVNIYKIPTSEHAGLRNMLTPYLEEANIDIPWLDD